MRLLQGGPRDNNESQRRPITASVGSTTDRRRISPWLPPSRLTSSVVAPRSRRPGERTRSARDGGAIEPHAYTPTRLARPAPVGGGSTGRAGADPLDPEPKPIQATAVSDHLGRIRTEKREPRAPSPHGTERTDIPNTQMCDVSERGYLASGCARKNAQLWRVASTPRLVGPANHSGIGPPPGQVWPPPWMV